METLLLSEGFDELEDILMPAVDEGTSPDILGWTHTPPEEWVVANVNPSTGAPLPGIDDPFEGVEEWEGWSFTTPEFWVAADTQRRSEFVLGQGVIAVADPDEWDDLGDPEIIGERECPTCGPYNTLLVTPPIAIADVTPGSLRVEFDSSWRPEFDSSNQRAELVAHFDNGAPLNLVNWTSDGGEQNCNQADDGELCFKDDNSTNEHLSIPISAPGGAETVTLYFELLDAGNDWWWAIDNVDVYGDVEATQTPACDFDADMDCDVVDIDMLMVGVGTAAQGGGAVAGPAPTPFDLTDDGVVDDLDRDAWLSLAAEENRLSAPYQLGDTNLDLIVDATDLNEVGISWQIADEHRWSKGNFSGGGVNAPDLNEVGINWQQRHPDAPAGAAVPEPSGMLLLFIGLLGSAGLRRCQ